MMLNPGKWQGCFSWNVEENRSRWVRGDNFAQRLTEKFAHVQGFTLANPPEHHHNPETDRRPVQRRGVWTVNVWFQLAQAHDSLVLVHAANEAFQAAGAGSDWQVPVMDRAMAECRQMDRTNTEMAREIGASVLLGPIIGGEIEQSKFGVVCATFRPYDDAPPPAAGINGTLGRLGAGPIQDSNNPRRINEEEPVFIVPGVEWPISPFMLKVAGGVVGGVAVIFIVGYTARGIANLIREAK